MRPNIDPSFGAVCAHLGVTHYFRQQSGALFEGSGRLMEVLVDENHEILLRWQQRGMNT